MSDIERLLKLGASLGKTGTELQAWADEKFQEQNIAAERELERKKIEKDLELKAYDAEKEAIQARKQEQESKKALVEKEIELLNLRRETGAGEISTSLSTPSSSTQGTENELFNGARPKIPRLPMFDESNTRIDHYLERFERYVSANNFRTNEYATVLSAYLKGSALEVYSRLSTEESKDYEKLKKALMKQYEVTPDSCRQDFRSMDMKKDETFTQLRDRLDQILVKWITLSDGKVPGPEDRSLWEIIIMEQMANMCGRELQIHIKERSPKTSLEFATLADKFREARKSHSHFLHRKSGGGTHADKRDRNTTGKPTGRETGQKDFCSYCKKGPHTIEQCFLKKRHAFEGRQSENRGGKR